MSSRIEGERRRAEDYAPSCSPAPLHQTQVAHLLYWKKRDTLAPFLIIIFQRRVIKVICDLSRVWA